ncbi:MAG: 16S rRNA (uracil(1498)-N(3))-methyltransferase [Gammaproteobacteria bacterium]|nr:16S rRNA (uracil(1498)-N(3))-methyltransferase [Gammaproteobacteria bacterium]MBU0787248.1 16S rRNA (uracil(1498)-N(3))-methyltransferase [Gammaproteobacteria bacterium]MBU0815988.1 16S rRNA (uracil(1498)-N(3))-methyltransferase [Gammaproteobacteria bacterium]MBU1787527.1 16S rRNA (uracil(1498)-N(3))-methyltransferase [Gammaproteobacteria bacterium]
MPRFYCPAPLITGDLLDLPAGAARHVQVLRLQPGDTVTLFGGQVNGGEFEATITRMGRSDVQVQVGAHQAMERETACEVHLLIGMPANERMDWLVEKATELGVASIQPLTSERSVLRLSGERADKKLAHWRGIAIAACEQCGRNRVPLVHPVQSLGDWMRHPAATTHPHLLLSLRPGTLSLRQTIQNHPAGVFTFLSGPEGGLSAAEEALALAQGFVPVTLGSRVLRAETAPLAALAALTLLG